MIVIRGPLYSSRNREAYLLYVQSPLTFVPSFSPCPEQETFQENTFAHIASICTRSFGVSWSTLLRLSQ